MIINRIKPSVTRLGGVMIFPGNNILTKEDTEKVQADEQFKINLQTGQIKIVDKHETAEAVKTKEEKENEAGATGIAEEIAGLNGNDAIDVIKDIVIVAELEKIIAGGEKRKKVLKAIDRQIEEIKAVPDPEDETTED